MGVLGDLRLNREELDCFEGGRQRRTGGRGRPIDAVVIAQAVVIAIEFKIGKANPSGIAPLPS